MTSRHRISLLVVGLLAAGLGRCSDSATSSYTHTASFQPQSQAFRLVELEAHGLRDRQGGWRSEGSISVTAPNGRKGQIPLVVRDGKIVLQRDVSHTPLRQGERLTARVVLDLMESIGVKLDHREAPREAQEIVNVAEAMLKGPTGKLPRTQTLESVDHSTTTAAQ